MIGFAVEQIPGEGVAVRSVGVLSRHWSARETQTKTVGGPERQRTYCSGVSRVKTIYRFEKNH